MLIDVLNLVHQELFCQVCTNYNVQSAVCLLLILSLSAIQFVCLHFFLALCRIFLDEEAPDQVLEVTARAITYYLDVSAECTRRIVAVEGAIKAMCNRYVLI